MPIDHPRWLWRSWDGNRGRCWVRPLDASEIVEPAELDDAVFEEAEAESSALRPRAPVAVAVRLWQHRSPRPDAAALCLLLRPRPAAVAHLRLPPWPAEAHKDPRRAIAAGLAAGRREVAGFPLDAAEVVALELIDDGPASAAGLEQLGALAMQALLLEARRREALSFL